jgi:hypothetical protein
VELKDLKKSISDLNDAELRELLSGIRSNRRISKRPPAVQRESKAKGEVSTEALMNSITPEMAAMLLERLGGGKND